MRRYAMLFSIVGIVVSLTWDVSAELIEFQFSGAVTRITKDDLWEPTTPPHPWDKVNVGDPWSLKYTFDSAAIPYVTHVEEDGGGCAWYHTIQACHVKVGKAVWQPNSFFPEYGVGDIMVFDNYPERDEYFVYIVGDDATMTIELFFWGPETVWDSYELPLCGDITLSSFEYRSSWVYLHAFDLDMSIHGSVDQHSCGRPIVVEPPGPPVEPPALVAVLSNPITASDPVQLDAAQFFPDMPTNSPGSYDWSIVSGDDKMKFMGFPGEHTGIRINVKPIAKSTSRNDVKIKVKFTSYSADVPSCEAYHNMTVLKPTFLRVAEGFPKGPDIHYNSQGDVVGYVVDYAFQVYDQFDEPIPVEGMQVKERMDVLCRSHAIIFPSRFETYWTNESGVWEEQLGTPYHDLYNPIPEDFHMKIDQDIYVEGWLVDTRCQTYRYDYATSEEGSCTGICY